MRFLQAAGKMDFGVLVDDETYRAVDEGAC